MEPLIGEWFQSKFKGLTEPQAYAVPIIHARKNVLVSSPTGSGKTLTAFLSIINELYAKQLRGELEDRIYCLYVSPLRRSRTTSTATSRSRFGSSRSSPERKASPNRRSGAAAGPGVRR